MTPFTTNRLLASFILLLCLSATAQAAQFKGRLEWLHKVELRVLESGIVTKMKLTVGQLVKKGEVLLQIDPSEFKAKLEEADARVAQAKIKSADAEREYGRTKELYDRALIADEELKDAELNKAVAKADEASAKAKYQIAKIALDRTMLRAPFHAIVVSHNVWKGDVIFKSLQKEAPITVAPSNQMLARILITANVLKKYRKGQPATVFLQGKKYSGRIYSLGVEPVRIDISGAVYELDVIFNRNHQVVMRQAETVQVNLP